MEALNRRLLVVGNPEPLHVGAHLLAAAKSIGVETRLVDQRQSWGSNRWLNRLTHRFMGRLPTRIRPFGIELEAEVRDFRPEVVVVTGIAAPSAATLRALREGGVQTANFLTDDPWNPQAGAKFFWAAMREYDVIFTPRRANIDDLLKHGCRRVEYLPFGYNPDVHFREVPVTTAERERFCADVTILGGADEDRIPLATSLAQQGLRLRLFGGYWDRWRHLRPFYRGFAYGRDLRMAVSGATVNVCLVRKANRDGHAMRSLEFPAMGACLAVEDTAEHRELFGPEENCVEYYTTPDEMAEKVKRLCAQPERARELGAKVLQQICRDSRNTYADRLRQVLEEMANP